MPRKSTISVPSANHNRPARDIVTSMVPSIAKKTESIVMSQRCTNEREMHCEMGNVADNTMYHAVTSDLGWIWIVSFRHTPYVLYVSLPSDR
jgi:hypothetical protein